MSLVNAPVGNSAGLRVWEHALIGRAYQAHDCVGAEEAGRASAERVEHAYERCREITAEASKTFYLASGLIPAEKRKAVRALYAFCRVTDDLVDRGPDPALGPAADTLGPSLAAWRESILSRRAPADDPVALAWADTQARYRVPVCLSEQFFAGVECDLTRARYETFDQLAEYCYGVASTVGLMVMHIVGYGSPDAIPYAVKLGVALQLTNILRDVAEDWAAGRLYLPLAELAEYGLTEAFIASAVRPGANLHRDERWQAFLASQIARNRRLYAEAAPGIPMLGRDGRFAIGAAAGLYQAILNDIEAHEGDVFHRRAHVGKWGKLRRLPGIWWRSRV